MAHARLLPTLVVAILLLSATGAWATAAGAGGTAALGGRGARRTANPSAAAP